MILNTGSRTDIPAYYSGWFYNRINEGYVLTRNPFNPNLVLKYELNPQIIDILSFCTKNPKPMLNRLNELDLYRQFWFITLTPYGKDIEPNVPNKLDVLDSIKELSNIIGYKNVSLRYDPIFINDKYSMNYHIRAFNKILSELEGKINFCVISFIDLYEKTKRNFPEVKEVSVIEQEYLTEQFVQIAKKYNIEIHTCCENSSLARLGVNVSGCMTKEIFETVFNERLIIPNSKKSVRDGCDCLLGSDIGMYNTCLHGCKYCYANYDMNLVKQNYLRHNPNSPLLIGELKKEDIIIQAKHESYISNQLTLF